MSDLDKSTEKREKRVKKIETGQLKTPTTKTEFDSLIPQDTTPPTED